MDKAKTQLDLLEEISAKLDLLVGISLVAEKPEDDQIEILRGMGHDWNTIGTVVGMKGNAARVRFDRKKKRKKKKVQNGKAE